MFCYATIICAEKTKCLLMHNYLFFDIKTLHGSITVYFELFSNSSGFINSTVHRKTPLLLWFQNWQVRFTVFISWFRFILSFIEILTIRHDLYLFTEIQIVFIIRLHKPHKLFYVQYHYYIVYNYYLLFQSINYLSS